MNEASATKGGAHAWLWLGVLICWIGSIVSVLVAQRQLVASPLPEPRYLPDTASLSDLSDQAEPFLPFIAIISLSTVLSYTGMLLLCRIRGWRWACSLIGLAGPVVLLVSALIALRAKRVEQ